MGLRSWPPVGAVLIRKSLALLNPVIRLARMLIQRNDPGLADAVTINFAQVFDGLLHAFAGDADAIDRDEPGFVLDQRAGP